MNCAVDEHGPVEVEVLTYAHFKRIDTPVSQQTRMNADGSTARSPPGIIWPKQKDANYTEPTIQRSTAIKVGSQECVGQKTNGEWAKYRIAHKNKRSGADPPLTAPTARSHKLIVPCNTDRHVSWDKVIATCK